MIQGEKEAIAVAKIAATLCASFQLTMSDKYNIIWAVNIAHDILAAAKKKVAESNRGEQP